MKILITGIHGFIGTNIVAAQNEKHTIFGLDIVSQKMGGVARIFSWNELDQIPSVDVIIHLAGKAHDTKNKSNAQVYFAVNTGLTQKIFDWFLATNAKKFIFFSSTKAAADQVDSGILTEDVVPAPEGPYGESKIEAEKYILSQTLSEDKRVYILRPCMIHGPGNKGNLNLLYNIVIKGIPYPLGAFENKRSFASMDNVVFVIKHIIENEIDSGTYNLADDDPLSTNELIKLFAASKDRNAHIWKINKKLIKWGANLGGLLHFPLNPERLKKLTESYLVSNHKLKKALKIDKMPVSAEEGMKRTLKSFK